MRFFLGAHGPCFALDRVEQPRFLIDGTAILEDRDLAARFIFNRLANETDRVHVLDFTARAEFATGATNRNVHVGAHGAFVHIAVAGAEITDNRAQLGQIGAGLIRRAQVRLGHDFHQGNARTVQVDIGHGRMLVVHGLARILLQMQALNADLHVFELALIVRADRNHDLALADDGLFELRNLIALRQIGIEIVLAVENRFQVDLRIESDARANRLLDAFQIDDRQHARHGRIHERNI